MYLVDFSMSIAILSVESYHGDSDDIKNQQGQFTFSRDLAKTTPNLGSHVLLVDDLADSGKTLTKSIKWLEHFYGFYLKKKSKLQLYGINQLQNLYLTIL